MTQASNGPAIQSWTQHRAAETARQELILSVERFGQVPLGIETIHLGLLTDLPDRYDLIRRGLINLHNVDPGKDAFEALRLDRDVYLLGNTPRGLLHAVYAFQDKLAFDPALGFDWHAHGVFRIGQRIFHPRFDQWPGERADIRYLSHLGASHCLVCHDWQGDLRNFQGYVTSPIFPDAVPSGEVERQRSGLRRLIDDCSDYGIGCALWITELPCQGGPWVPEPERQAWLDRFPAEVLSDSGTYQGKVLCFAHPQVQAFYRDIVRRFFADFPEVETVFLFGMDSGGEGCDPESCPRCRGVSKFEQRDRLLRFIAEEGGRVRPGLRVLTTNWHWEFWPEEFLERQEKLPAASGVYAAAECDGWQAERQSHDFLRRTRSICRERGQLFIGYDDFHLGDDATHLWGADIQDFPLGIGAKMARWHDLEVDGVFDHWGTYSEMISTNSVACREFFLNPLADPETICRRLAHNQYGSQAGEHAFLAWTAIERAHRILSNCSTWCPWQWPGWYGAMGEAPLPESLLKHSQSLDKSRLLPKSTTGFVYNSGDLADCLEAVGAGWKLAAPHLEEACRCLDEAIAATDDQPVGYAHWWNGAAKSPGTREHLARHKVYVEFMMLTGREIGLQFELLALFERLGHSAEAFLAEAGELLKEDLKACREIVACIDRLLADYPEVANLPAAKWRGQYARKVDQLQEWFTQRTN